MSRTPYTAANFIPVTTVASQKRHWSLTPTGHWGPSTLCGHTGFTQAEVDDRMPPRWRTRKVIADLPPCAQCDKSRQRRIDGRPS